MVVMMEENLVLLMVEMKVALTDSKWVKKMELLLGLMKVA